MCQKITGSPYMLWCKKGGRVSKTYKLKNETKYTLLLLSWPYSLLSYSGGFTLGALILAIFFRTSFNSSVALELFRK